MKPYLIVAHDYRRTSAGVRALHKLCHALNGIPGVVSFVLADEVNEEWNTPQANHRIVEWIAKDGIVVYPEVEDGNKLGARRVVRYLLNRPGFIRDATFGENEVRFCYCGLLREFVPDSRHILTVPVVDAHLFTDEVGLERYNEILWVGKWTGDRFLDESGMVEITLDWPERVETLVDLFRSAVMFYSYTDYTALTIEARLCACPAAIAPSGHYDGLYDGGMPGGTTGMAVGFSDDELRRAQDTVGAFRGRYLQEVSAFYDSQIYRFLDITQNMKPTEGGGS